MRKLFGAGGVDGGMGGMGSIGGVDGGVDGGRRDAGGVGGGGDIGGGDVGVGRVGVDVSLFGISDNLWSNRSGYRSLYRYSRSIIGWVFGFVNVKYRFSNLSGRLSDIIRRH